MGSNPSRSVVMDIHIPTTDRGRPKYLYKTAVNNVENKDGFKVCYQGKVKETDLVALLVQMRVELRQSKHQAAAAEEKAATLQEQLTEREDEIISLQTQVEVQAAREMEQQQTPVMERTVKVKDQYIQRLEAEMQQLRQQSTEVNEKYVRKLHKVRAMSSKSRQDSSLRMFELKDANVKLKEENAKLKDRTNVSSASSCRGAREDEDLNAESTTDDTRTKLILELSQQVAELDQENSRLKRELKYTRKIAEKVAKAKSSSGTSKAESLCFKAAVPEGSPTFIKGS